MTRRVVLAIWGALLALFVVAHARAAGPANGPTLELRVIHATKVDGGGSIDPALRDLPQLTRDQPFVRYNVYKLLDQRQVPLEAGKPVTYTLVNGRTLQVTLTDVTDDRNEKRYHVRTEIQEPGTPKKAFLRSLEVTASANEAFFVGGQSYQGGTLFIELVVRP
jgi:hypothetical protein